MQVPTVSPPACDIVTIRNYDNLAQNSGAVDNLKNVITFLERCNLLYSYGFQQLNDAEFFIVFTPSQDSNIVVKTAWNQIVIVTKTEYFSTSLNNTNIYIDACRTTDNDAKAMKLLPYFPKLDVYSCFNSVDVSRMMTGSIRKNLAMGLEDAIRRQNSYIKLCYVLDQHMNFQCSGINPRAFCDNHFQILDEVLVLAKRPEFERHRYRILSFAKAFIKSCECDIRDLFWARFLLNFPATGAERELNISEAAKSIQHVPETLKLSNDYTFLCIYLARALYSINKPREALKLISDKMIVSSFPLRQCQAIEVYLQEFNLKIISKIESQKPVQVLIGEIISITDSMMKIQPHGGTPIEVDVLQNIVKYNGRTLSNLRSFSADTHMVTCVFGNNSPTEYKIQIKTTLPEEGDLTEQLESLSIRESDEDEEEEDDKDFILTKAAAPGVIQDVCDSDDEESSSTATARILTENDQPRNYSWDKAFKGDFKDILLRSLSTSLFNGSNKKNEQFAEDILSGKADILRRHVQILSGVYYTDPNDDLHIKATRFCTDLGIIREGSSHTFIDTLVNNLLDFIKKRCQENLSLARRHLITHPDDEVFFCFHKCRSKSTVCVQESWVRMKLYQHARSFKLNTNSQDLMMKNISKFLDSVTMVDLLRVSMTTDEAGLRHYLVTHSPTQTPINIIEKFILSITHEKGEGDEPCKWIYRQRDSILESERSGNKKKSIIVTVEDSDDEDTIDVN